MAHQPLAAHRHPAATHPPASSTRRSASNDASRATVAQLAERQRVRPRPDPAVGRSGIQPAPPSPCNVVKAHPAGVIPRRVDAGRPHAVISSTIARPRPPHLIGHRATTTVDIAHPRAGSVHATIIPILAASHEAVSGAAGRGACRHDGGWSAGLVGPGCCRRMPARYGAAAMSESSDPAGIDGRGGHGLVRQARSRRRRPVAVRPGRRGPLVPHLRRHRCGGAAGPSCGDRRSATSWRPPTTSPASTGSWTTLRDTGVPVPRMIGSVHRPVGQRGRLLRDEPRRRARAAHGRGRRGAR